MSSGARLRTGRPWQGLALRHLAIMLAAWLCAAPAVVAAADGQRLGVPRIITVFQNEDGSESVSYGSSVAVGADLVLTNLHVVSDPARIRLGVFTIGPRGVAGVLRATVIAESAAADLALLRTENAVFTPLNLAGALPDTDADVFAVGYPGAVDDAYGRDFRQRAEPGQPERFKGIISSLNERSPTGEAVMVINHDAPIAPGNSGGPLLDECGNIVGINSWVDRPTGRYGFAVAASEVRRFLDDNDIAAPEAGEACLGAEARARLAAAEARAALAAAETRSAQAAERARSLDAAMQAARAAQAERERLLVLAVLAFGALAIAYGWRSRRRAGVPAAEQAREGNQTDG